MRVYLLARIGALALFSAAALAQTACYEYFNSSVNGGQRYGSSSAVVSAYATYWNANPQCAGSGVERFCNLYASSGCSVVGSGASGNETCPFTWTRVPADGGVCGPVNCTTVFNGELGVAYEQVEECPELECEEEAHKFTAGNVEGPNQYCSPLACQYNVLARTGDTMVVENTGQTCDRNTEPPPGGQPEEGDEGERCQAVGDGEYCASPNGGGQCGYLNDTYVCLQNVIENECKTLGDGGRVCGSQANTTPPVPDNGTAGEVATPDGTIEHTTNNPDTNTTVTNVYHYYNPTTVSGSSRDPGTDGAAPTGGSPGYGNDDGEGGDGGSGECEGGETCGRGVPTLEDVGTMTEAFTAFWSGLQQVPIVDAASDVAPSFSAGTCPDWSSGFTLYNESVDMDFGFICTTWDDVSPVLSLAALVLWGLLALRLLMSA